MNFLIDTAQLKHFRTTQAIEFEDFLSKDSIKALLNYFKPLKKSEKTQLKNGFDIWKNKNIFKKIICSNKTPFILAQLLERSQVRYGYSQYIAPNCTDPEFILSPKKSCIKHFIGGVCVCLSEPKESENPFCPTKVGNALFFKMDEDFYLRYPDAKGSYLFIFFAEPKAFFTHVEEDPLTPFFRNQGYEQGDSLQNEKNPLYSWSVR